ncbi:hypothetical protein EJB05_09280, partial [Eragrostis curvula]
MPVPSVPTSRRASPAACDSTASRGRTPTSGSSSGCAAAMETARAPAHSDNDVSLKVSLASCCDGGFSETTSTAARSLHGIGDAVRAPTVYFDDKADSLVLPHTLLYNEGYVKINCDDAVSMQSGARSWGCVVGDEEV